MRIPVLDHRLDRLKAFLDRHTGAKLVAGTQLRRDLVFVDREVMDFDDGKQELAVHFGWEFISICR